ncbi:MAG TPA: transaldolase [Lachnospiraceae bacterium]|jgi:transaldolase|nr:transaldolase family protein [Lachnospiraceae bacterium]HAN50565.1 transaldolase [Lachnospiraceae bacterium]
MMANLGTLAESVKKFPMTDLWMDSCGEEELDYGILRGIVGATSNPIIVGNVVKNEMDKWEPEIKKLIQDMPEATEDEITWALIDEVGALRSKKLLPKFEEFKGKKGRLSIQVNAKYYRDPKRMVEQAMHLNSLGKNMMIKIPASAAGIKAIEEATYRGASTNATVSFTVAQAVAVAEAVERGMTRREAEGLPTEDMGPVCTIMIGRTDDWLKKYVNKTGMVVDPECLEWAGVAVIKEAYRIYKERGYRTRLLSAANRNHYHWSQLLGGDLAQTINYSWWKRLEACDIPVEEHMSDPVPERFMKELKKIPEFDKSFLEDGMKPEEFVHYGGFRDTLNQFLGGYEDLVHVIRSYMV